MADVEADIAPQTDATASAIIADQSNSDTPPPTEQDGDKPTTSGDGDIEMNGDAGGEAGAEAGAEAGEPNGDGEATKEEEEEVDDKDRLPDDACETLYLQNLNEHVRIPGQSYALTKLCAA